jgi:hypothetical protein
MLRLLRERVSAVFRGRGRLSAFLDFFNDRSSTNDPDLSPDITSEHSSFFQFTDYHQTCLTHHREEKEKQDSLQRRRLRLWQEVPGQEPESSSVMASSAVPRGYYRPVSASIFDGFGPEVEGDADQSTVTTSQSSQLPPAHVQAQAQSRPGFQYRPTNAAILDCFGDSSPQTLPPEPRRSYHLEPLLLLGDYSYPHDRPIPARYGPTARSISDDFVVAQPAQSSNVAATSHGLDATILPQTNGGDGELHPDAGDDW